MVKVSTRWEIQYWFQYDWDQPCPRFSVGNAFICWQKDLLLLVLYSWSAQTKLGFYNTLRIKMHHSSQQWYEEKPYFFIYFQSAAVNSFQVIFKQLHIWGVNNTKEVKFNKHSKNLIHLEQLKLIWFAISFASVSNKWPSWCIFDPASFSHNINKCLYKPKLNWNYA